jgi:DNA repair protein RecO (recombination protein O)
MKVYETKGIIFRTLKYSESSIICDIFTLEKGLRSFIVSGVRTSKSGSKAAIYQPLNIIEVISYDVESDKLARIKEIRLAHHYRLLNTSVLHSAIAIFILEVSRQSIKEREANEVLYQFLEHWFIFLDDEQNYHPSAHLLFLVELSLELGFGPLDTFDDALPYFDLVEGIFTLKYENVHVMPADVSLNLRKILAMNKCQLPELKLKTEERDMLLSYLIQFYKLHVSGFKDLNSLSVLKAVL